MARSVSRASGRAIIDPSASDDLDALLAASGVSWLRRQRLSSQGRLGLVVEHVPEQLLRLQTKGTALTHDLELDASAGRPPQQPAFDITGFECAVSVEERFEDYVPEILLSAAPRPPHGWVRETLLSLQTRTRLVELTTLALPGGDRIVCRREFTKEESPEEWVLRERAEDQARMLLRSAIDRSLDSPGPDGQAPRVAVIGPWSWLLQFAPGKQGRFQLRVPGREGPPQQPQLPVGGSPTGSVAVDTDAETVKPPQPEDPAPTEEDGSLPGSLRQTEAEEKVGDGLVHLRLEDLGEQLRDRPDDQDAQDVGAGQAKQEERDGPTFDWSTDAGRPAPENPLGYRPPADPAPWDSDLGSAAPAVDAEPNLPDGGWDEDEWDDDEVMPGPGFPGDPSSGSMADSGDSPLAISEAGGDAAAGSGGKATDYLTFQHRRLMLQAQRLEERRQLEAQLVEGLEAVSLSLTAPHLYDLTGVWAVSPAESEDLGPLMELFGLSRDAQHLCRRLDLQLRTMIWHSADGTFCLSERLQEPGLRLEIQLGDYFHRPSLASGTLAAGPRGQEGREGDPWRCPGVPAIFRNKTDPSRITRVYGCQRGPDVDDAVRRRVLLEAARRSGIPAAQLQWAGEDCGAVVLRSQFPQDGLEIVDVRRMVSRSRLVQTVEVLDDQGTSLLKLRRLLCRVENHVLRDFGDARLYPLVTRQRTSYQRLKDCERMLRTLRRKLRRRWASAEHMRRQETLLLANRSHQEQQLQSGPSEAEEEQLQALSQKRSGIRRQWRLLEQQYCHMAKQFLMLLRQFRGAEAAKDQLFQRFGTVVPTFVGGGEKRPQLDSESSPDDAPEDAPGAAPEPGLPVCPRDVIRELRSQARLEDQKWVEYLAEVEAVRLTTRIREMNSLAGMLGGAGAAPGGNGPGAAGNRRSSSRGEPRGETLGPVVSESVHRRLRSAGGIDIPGSTPGTPSRRGHGEAPRSPVGFLEGSFSPAYRPARSPVSTGSRLISAEDAASPPEDEDLDGIGSYMMQLYEQQHQNHYHHHQQQQQGFQFPGHAEFGGVDLSLRRRGWGGDSGSDDGSADGASATSGGAAEPRGFRLSGELDMFGFFSATPSSFNGLWRCVEEKSDDLGELYRLLGIGWWGRRSAKLADEVQELQLSRQEFRMVREWGKRKRFELQLPPDGEWHPVQQWQIGDAMMRVHRDWMNEEITCEVSCETLVSDSQKRLLEVRRLQTYRTMKHTLILYDANGQPVLRKNLLWLRVVE